MKLIQWFSFLFLIGMAGSSMGCAMMRHESKVGVTDGRLQPCPPYPRCVSSQSEDPAKFIEPLAYDGNTSAAMSRLKTILDGMKNSRLIREDSHYLHYEFRTSFWKFTDDVEIYADEPAKQIHFRSSSRIGYYDFKTNRKRIEAIQRQF